MRIVPYTKPSITNLEVDYAYDAAKNGWGKNCYDYINKFENIFRKYIKTKYVLSTSSCTGALHMGMHALGIGHGDEVILADTNWVATAAPILHLGAKPVYVDILPNTWCIDPDKVEAAITKKTKAIIAVHIYGNLCDMDRLLRIGKKYKIPIIEDAAEAIGSVYKGKKAGSMGVFGTFSFHGTKTVTTGEGGMFVTNKKILYEKVLTLSNHGRSRKQKKQFWPEFAGFKYKLSNIQAAIGYAQMKRIKDLIKRKREIFNFYFKFLKKLPLSMNPEYKQTINGYWMPTVVVDKKIKFKRDKLLLDLKKNKIDARVFFFPSSSTPIGGFKASKEKYISEEIHLRSFNLPSHHNILKKDMKKIIGIIKKQILNNNKFLKKQ